MDKKLIGLDNYVYFFNSSDALGALWNNAIWLVLLTTLTVGLGIDHRRPARSGPLRIRSRNRSIFLPLAISFVGAGVVWKFMYDYRPANETQTGTLNGLVAAAGGQPVPWLINAPGNTIALIVVAAWIWTGFCMVILSAALKSISSELLEAARIDGATELQVFRRTCCPCSRQRSRWSATTMIITSLKAFDIVYVMTNGAYDTEVIANRMYKELFSFGQPGRASAMAVVLLVLIIPVMLINIRRFREQERAR